MAKIPPASMENPVVAAIYAAATRRADEDGRNEPRRHLGASEIGKECRRALWYSFRWCSRWAPEGRMLRLLETGHLTEGRLVAELRSAGMDVRHAGSNSAQLKLSEPLCGDHFAGSCDGLVRGVPGAAKTEHLLELKTSNAKAWKTLDKGGVQKAMPRHYDQVQVYMMWTGTKRALYISVNKDTDEVYAERIRYDAGHAARLVEKAKGIIEATTPPDRISDDPSWFECRWCDAWDICHGMKLPAPVCRNCCHATPVTAQGGQRWTCDIDPANPVPMPDAPCGQHLYIPALMPAKEVVGLSATGHAIIYRTSLGVAFANGAGAPGVAGRWWSSEALHAASRAGDEPFSV